jgi:hypothetical protein
VNFEKMIRIVEVHRGFRGGEYYFVVDGNKLFHISYFASEIEVEKVGKKERDITYQIDLEKIKGKNVIEILSTNKRYTFAYIYPAEDLQFELDKRREKVLPLEALNNYEITWLDKDEKKFLNEWNNFYKPMISYIKENTEDIYSSNLVETHLKNNLKYPLSFFLPDKNSRKKSIEVLTRNIHQIWVCVRILKEFVSERLKLHFTQSSTKPIAIIKNYGLWFEFDLTPHTMFEGELWYRDGISLGIKEIFERAERIKDKYKLSKIPLRPDIVFTHAKNKNEFFENPSIKLVIECKNFDYEFWEKDIRKQIIPYVEIFNPEEVILASLKPVPLFVKNKLANFNIHVIDNVYPNGCGEKELIDYIKRSL